MVLWIMGQIATPHATSKPSNWWAVVIEDTVFAKCSSCLNHLKKTIITEFNSRGDTIQRISYSEMKRALYIWTHPDKALDVARLKEILKREGVRSYEILH